jgi:hypothetical protein
LDDDELHEWEGRGPAGGGGVAACRLRDYKPLARRSGGAVWAVCACGQILAVRELPGAESLSLVLLFMMQLWRGRDHWVVRPGREHIVMAYDNACQLLRFVQRRAAEHPKIAAWLHEVYPVVDPFHFQHNHKGKFCFKHTNPNKCPMLQEAKAAGWRNLSVCEQTFSLLNRYAHVVNPMNKSTFNFHLQLLVHLQREERERCLRQRGAAP